MNIIPLKERFFESIDGVIYVFDKAIQEAGISTNYYRKLKSTGSKTKAFINHPQDKRYSLVAFDTMSDAHRHKIKERFGNPADFIAREPILKMVVNDDEAFKFFLSHRYNGDNILPIQRVRQYARAASWLNLLKQVEESRNKAIKNLGITVPQFYNHMADIMASEQDNGNSKQYEGLNQLPAKFPTSYRKLRPRLQEYIAKGYPSLIDKMYGNQLAAKVNDEIAEAHLLELIADPKQYDDVLVCMMYNVWASKKGYKQIEPATVGVWRRKTEGVVIMQREGNAALTGKYIKQVKGFNPTAPLYLVEHDDNNLDFLFSDTDGYAFNKYVSIVVSDSHCNYVLGKSYMLGRTPQKEQVRHAYIDAMYNIRRLTGGWHMPFEIKADRWAYADLTPFYKSIGNFIPAGHGNKQRGYIEPLFSSKIWKRAQQLASPANNWTGNNMTAKYRGVNMEAIKLSAKDRPMIGNEAEMQIENFFHLLRNMPDFKRTNMAAASKEQQWLESWNKLSPDQKRPITDEQFLLTFGIKHTTDHANGIRITNRGVEPQINGRKLSYDLPETWMYDKLNGAKVNVVYDPFDMSRVLITNYDDIRFIAHTAQFQPRALKDHYTNSRTYLNAVLAEKKGQVEKIVKAAEKRKSIVDTSYFNAEALLQGGELLKELKNDAEALYIEQELRGSTLEDRLNQM